MLKYFSILLVSLSFIFSINMAYANNQFSSEDIDAMNFIFHVIADDDLERLENILSHNVNLKVLDEAGFSCVMYAIRHNRPEMLDTLLYHGAPKNVQDKIDGMTALMMAVYEGKYELVQIIMNYNPNLTLKDNYGLTALDIAKEYKHETIKELLINYGAQ